MNNPANLQCPLFKSPEQLLPFPGQELTSINEQTETIKHAKSENALGLAGLTAISFLLTSEDNMVFDAIVGSDFDISTRKVVSASVVGLMALGSAVFCRIDARRKNRQIEALQSLELS